MIQGLYPRRTIGTWEGGWIGECWSSREGWMALILGKVDDVEKGGVKYKPINGSSHIVLRHSILLPILVLYLETFLIFKYLMNWLSFSWKLQRETERYFSYSDSTRKCLKKPELGQEPRIQSGCPLEMMRTKAPETLYFALWSACNRKLKGKQSSWNSTPGTRTRDVDMHKGNITSTTPWRHFIGDVH